jgi:hypothetical protein
LLAGLLKKAPDDIRFCEELESSRESAMRQTFKQAVVSMVRNGSFEAVKNYLGDWQNLGSAIKAIPFAIWQS